MIMPRCSIHRENVVFIVHAKAMLAMSVAMHSEMLDGKELSLSYATS